MPYFTNDDLSLFYCERGAGNFLLLLPGNTASSAYHEEDLDYFGQHYHAVSLDFRGTGKSQRLSSRPEDWWNTCAEDAACLVSYLVEKQCFVMGTSGGANIALLFAIRYPEHVSGVIADSCAELYSPDNLRKEVSDRALRTDEQVWFWKRAHGEDWEAVVDADNTLLLKLADRGGNLFDGRLSGIQCPVLFTGSLKDSFIPDIGEQNMGMSKQITNSSVFLHNDGDHPLMWSCPDVFRSVSCHFLKRLVQAQNAAAQQSSGPQESAAAYLRCHTSMRK
jgi:valacyclovir hydrolase